MGWQVGYVNSFHTSINSYVFIQRVIVSIKLGYFSNVDHLLLYIIVKGWINGTHLNFYSVVKIKWLGKHLIGPAARRSQQHCYLLKKTTSETDQTHFGVWKVALFFAQAPATEEQKTPTIVDILNVKEKRIHLLTSRCDGITKGFGKC